MIRCPRCNVTVEGDAAYRLYIELAKYHVRKMFTQGRRSSVTKKGGVKITHTVRKPKDPGGPFVLR